jgi:integrase
VVDAEGNVRRVCRTQVLGYKRDIPTKKLALRELEARLAHINSPSYRPMRAATFGEFVARWEREILPTMKPSTQSTVRSQLRNRLSTFAGFALRDLQLSTIQSVVSAWKDSPKTVRNLVMTLRSIWGTARKQGYVSHDPLSDLVLPRLVKPKQRFFTEMEMLAIITQAQEPYKSFLWLAAETGMRAGELCALRWEDIREGCVAVERSVWRGHADTTKSGKVRAFPISEPLQAKLAQMHDGSVDLSGYVFSTRNGTPWDGNIVVKRKLYPLLDSLGIERAGLHAFRHGNETVMDRTLKSPIAVRLSRLGHSDTRMMVNYSHVISEDDRAVAEYFGNLFAPKCAENEGGHRTAIQ